MPRYRTREDQYFMGQYYDKGTVLELHEKQAKYPLMSGQIEAVDPVYAKPKHAGPKKGSEDNPVTPVAAYIDPKRLEQAPQPMRKKRGAAPVDKSGERTTGRTVGGTSKYERN